MSSSVVEEARTVRERLFRLRSDRPLHRPRYIIGNIPLLITFLRFINLNLAQGFLEFFRNFIDIKILLILPISFHSSQKELRGGCYLSRLIMFLKCLYLTLLHSCPASISPFFVMLHNSFCYGPPKYFSSMEYNLF